MTVTRPLGGTRVSKRVLPTGGQVQPVRITRQRTRIASSAEDGTTTNPLDGSIEDVLVDADSPTPAQHADLIPTRNEGKCFSSFLKAIYFSHLHEKFMVCNNCDNFYNSQVNQMP